MPSVLQAVYKVLSKDSPLPAPHPPPTAPLGLHLALELPATPATLGSRGTSPHQAPDSALCLWCCAPFGQRILDELEPRWSSNVVTFLKSVQWGSGGLSSCGICTACPPPLLAWSLQGQRPPLSSLPGPSMQQEPSEESGRETSLDWCSPVALDGRRPASVFAALLQRGGAGLSSDRAAGKLWVGGGQTLRARHRRLPERKGIRLCSSPRRGRGGSGRGRAGKPGVAALRPCLDPCRPPPLCG